MFPVSSETTRATASHSSVNPIAARCRVPSSRLTRGLTVSGRKHAAAAIRDSWMMIAPSCSGDFFLKDRDDQVVGERRVERDAAFDVVPQADLALDDDDGADPLRRQRRRRDDELLDRFVGRLLAIEIPEKRRLAEVRERAADVGLEDDDRRKGDERQHVPDHPVQGLERRQARDVETAPRSATIRPPSGRHASP